MSNAMDTSDAVIEVLAAEAEALHRHLGYDDGAGVSTRVGLLRRLEAALLALLAERRALVSQIADDQRAFNAAGWEVVKLRAALGMNPMAYEPPDPTMAVETEPRMIVGALLEIAVGWAHPKHAKRIADAIEAERAAHKAERDALTDRLRDMHARSEDWASTAAQYLAERDAARAALAEAAIWHEAQAKALSKQPPGGDLDWRRMEHGEQAATLRAIAGQPAEPKA